MECTDEEEDLDPRIQVFIDFTKNLFILPHFICNIIISYIIDIL